MTSFRPVPPTDPRGGTPSRRTLLATAAAFGLLPEAVQAQATAPEKPATPGSAPAEAAPPSLPATPGKARLRPEPAAETPIWCFDGKTVPPLVRIKLGQPVRLKIENRTDKPLSLHWHGVRNVNAMDGVGGVTQAPIQPGADFLYQFTPPDAGTYLIRPLVVGGSSEPSGRGLAG
ncbi:MAG: copper resistance protein, partial [Methylobacterium brachiatum]|nr:copper resistance protein [Methylobacterium brachiatum]